MIRKHFRFKRFAIGLAFAAITAPAAQAATYYVDGGTVPVSQSASALQIRSEHSLATPTLTPLQVEGLRRQALANAYQQPSLAISERSFGVPGPSPSYAPVVLASSSDGFNWQDAGIGASVAFAIALCLLTAVALGRRRRSGLDSRLTSA